MNAIIFEVKNYGLSIPVMATMLSNNSGNIDEDKLLSDVGYGNHGTCLLTTLKTGATRNSPFKWDFSRTLYKVHSYTQDRYYELKSGDVINVQCILNEKFNKK